MVPPRGFEFNSETAASNSFQNPIPIQNAKEKALEEHAQMVKQLQELGINVLLLEQNTMLPDAVFPNNWFSTHREDKGNRILIIYPMLTQNRKAEVNIDGLLTVLKQQEIRVDTLIDLRNEENQILEGTGSLVIDADNKMIYSCISPRTSPILSKKVAQLLDYKLLLFHSVDAQNQSIYHTNVILSITRNYAIICLESIKDSTQRIAVQQSLEVTHKLLIDISLDQVTHFCANVLELFNTKGQSILLMSSQAYRNFTQPQLISIERFSQIISVNLETIETLGGGSARCMMAEIN